MCLKYPDKYTCADGSVVYHGDSSYMISVKWEDFIENPETHIKKAYDLQSNIGLYNIQKEI